MLLKHGEDVIINYYYYRDRNAAVEKKIKEDRQEAPHLAAEIYQVKILCRVLRVHEPALSTEQ